MKKRAIGILLFIAAFLLPFEMMYYYHYEWRELDGNEGEYAAIILFTTMGGILGLVIAGSMMFMEDDKNKR